MAPGVVLVDEAVVVDEVAVAGVVGRVDAEALHLPGVGGPQRPQAVEVVALDNQVFEGSLAGMEIRHGIQHHEVLVQRPVRLDRVALPDQPELLPIPRLEQLDELLPSEVAVVLFRHGRVK